MEGKSGPVSLHEPDRYDRVVEWQSHGPAKPGTRVRFPPRSVLKVLLKVIFAIAYSAANS
jgi:hypothetical protein